ncbi:MAG: hypothetical protein SPI18_06310 [Prevotella sp.]|nr:hypothetical protein [Prevotella sp.]
MKGTQPYRLKAYGTPPGLQTDNNNKQKYYKKKYETCRNNM